MQYQYYEDPTNFDITYRRNNVRHEILPNLSNKDKIIDRLLKTYNINKNRYEKFMLEYSNISKNYILHSNNRITIPKNLLIDSSY